jgi:site-specific recombinase XerD
MEARELALKSDASKVEIGAKKTIPGTVNAAMISYYQSAAFTNGIADSTRGNRRAILEQFRTDHADKRIALVHSTAIQNILNKKTPAAARNWKKALRGFIDHCLALNMIKADPLVGLKLVKLKSMGHHPWESDECAQFEEHHPLGTRARLAYELLLQAGQSRADVVRMGRQHVRNGTMSLRRQKTDVPFYVAVMPRLRAAIDAMPVGEPSKKHLTFLVTAQGKPFTAAGFGNWFRDVCREAKLPERCTSHGLRKAAATYLAEQGATDHQLMA